MDIKIDAGMFPEGLYRGALHIVKRLRDSGYEAFFVGGAVRDVLMGRIPSEIDIATGATPEDIKGLFEKVYQVGAKFGVSVISVSGINYEAATYRHDDVYSDCRHPDSVVFSDITQDALRRDFTINALYWDPVGGDLMDFSEGIRDIGLGVIRTVGDAWARFNEDRLRIIRAIRFSCQLGFKIDPAVYDSIKRINKPFTGISIERIRDEIERILLSDDPARGISLMDEAGLLKEILPELCFLKGVMQPPEFHPEGDVWEHTINALEIAAKKVEQRGRVLMWSVLLHDIAKPVCVSYPADDNDRIRFNKHDVVGEKMVRDILSRLKLPVRIIESVAYVVKDHMRIGVARNIRKGRLRLMMAREEFPDELSLNYIDSMASHGDLGVWHMLSAEYREFIERNMLPDKLVTGTLLIGMGYSPSELFSEIIRESFEAQLEGSFNDVEGAKNYVKGRWPLGFLQ
ncbi:MAG: CCA tRNA nucleotidyltransferase [Oligoflexia bacterium]|nr:CCA tRNA nucleotidyltransferase [Oligoflexia bacterium]